MKTIRKKIATTNAAGLLLLSVIFAIQTNCFASGQTHVLPKLYKITGDGMDKPSYLFGTIHAICPDAFVFPENALSALGKSEQVIQELDFSSPDLVQEFQANMLLPGEQDISMFVDDPTRQRISRFMEDGLGVHFDQVKRMKPMLLLSIFNPYFLGCQPKSYDMYIHGLAIERGIKIVPLETPSQQIEYLDAIPVDDQIAMLVEMIDNPEEAKNKFHMMIQLYLNGETEALQELLLDLSAGTPELNEILMVQRNTQWIKKLPEMLEKPSFICVGVGHLYGAHGLLEKLRNKGYSVDPI